MKGLGFELEEFFCFVLVVVGVFGVLGNVFNELSNIFLEFGLEFDILSGLGCFVGKFVLEGI